MAVVIENHNTSLGSPLPSYEDMCPESPLPNANTNAAASMTGRPSAGDSQIEKTGMGDDIDRYIADMALKYFGYTASKATYQQCLVAFLAALDGNFKKDARIWLHKHAEQESKDISENEYHRLRHMAREDMKRLGIVAQEREERPADETPMMQYRPPHITLSAPDLYNGTPRKRAEGKDEVNCSCDEKDNVSTRPCVDQDQMEGDNTCQEGPVGKGCAMNVSINDLEQENNNSDKVEASPETKRRCVPSRECTCVVEEEDDPTFIPSIPPPMHPLIRRAISLPDVQEVIYYAPAPLTTQRYYVVDAGDEEDENQNAFHHGGTLHIAQADHAISPPCSPVCVYPTSPVVCQIDSGSDIASDISIISIDSNEAEPVLTSAHDVSVDVISCGSAVSENQIDLSVISVDGGDIGL